ncbi:entericidin A/B family lipoprotein [Ampullimonas aquatilis]|uniref:entericidin A/B family lipoprotein n=1 Tax=Ampullimonas aquatilis TaxID=1341549 RepID=UPI003C73B135
MNDKKSLQQLAKRVTPLLILSGFLIGLSGCNTIKGAGKDVERGGEVIQDKASETQKKM